MKIQERYTKILTHFLKSRPLISLNALEKLLAIPQSTLYKAVSVGRLIPVKHIFPLICELSKYGLEIDNHRLWLDEDTYTVFATRDEELIETIEDPEGSFSYIVKQYRWIIGDYSDL